LAPPQTGPHPAPSGPPAAELRGARNRRRDRHRAVVAAAIVASVALHLPLGAALSRALRPGATPPRPERMEVTLVPARPARSPEALPRSPPPAPPPRAPLARGPAPGTASPAASPSGLPAPPWPASAPPPPAAEASGPTGDLLGAPAPADVPGVAMAPRAEIAPDLRTRPPPDLAATLVPQEEGASERLDRLFREDSARARVKSGLVDPSMLDLGRALLKAWDPEKTVTQGGLSGYAQQLGKNVVDYAGLYADQASRYARSGSPLDPSRPAPSGLQGRAAVPDGLAANVTRDLEMADQLREQTRTRRVTTVRVVQRADGQILSVELFSPSEDGAVDAQALRDLRAAAARMPPPSPEALHGRPVLASLWELELDVSISPPLPVVGVQFDEVLGFGDVRVPLDRRVYKRVRLIAVE